MSSVALSKKAPASPSMLGWGHLDCVGGGLPFTSAWQGEDRTRHVTIEGPEKEALALTPQSLKRVAK